VRSTNLTERPEADAHFGRGEELNTFMGYERPDGRVGARNHVAVIPSVACANGVVNAIVREVPEAVPLYHGHGCARAGRDLELHFRALNNLGTHPNVAAALVVGLGCEVIKAELLAGGISGAGRRVEHIDIQEEGGSRKAAAKGAEIARGLVVEAAALERTEVSGDRLVLGLECGGSDAFSGITANPVVGLVSDRVVAGGGTVILTENTEMIGTSHILERRSATPEVAARVRDMIAAAERRTHDILGPLASMVIAPGNMDGGMSSIQEKSMGCIAKAGTSDIVQVVDYGEPPSENGLVLMDGPGYDVESMTGVAATGAQVILFTTGRGNPIGFPVVPVVKIASNAGLFESMEDDMDVNAGAVLEKGLDAVGEEIIGLLEKVLNGRRTKAEINRQDGILCLYTTGPSF
jgi:altronate dehydratase large subunit